MKVIVPMAGRGSRLRPHTLITPKPLVQIAGRSIVRRLLEEINALLNEPIEEISFIIGDFGREAETELEKIAEDLGCSAHIFYQDQPLGTAHAIWQAAEKITGETIVAFADTLFTFPEDFSLDLTKDGLIWVKKVDDPQNYGVITLDENGAIDQFVEKPEAFVSDLGILGIYYVEDGNKMKEKIRYILENNIKDKGEFQFTSVLDIMRQEGKLFFPAEVTEWMDCGNKKVLLETTAKVLEFEKRKGSALIADDVELVNSLVIPPCYIGKGVRIERSVIGPYVAIDEQVNLNQVVAKNTTIRSNTHIVNAVIKDTMVGKNASSIQQAASWDLGDYCHM